MKIIPNSFSDATGVHSGLKDVPKGALRVAVYPGRIVVYEPGDELPPDPPANGRALRTWAWMLGKLRAGRRFARLLGL